jgi:UDP-N-acetylmuramoyl-tripeptide--D-alanyl-D-alanine ligase
MQDTNLKQISEKTIKSLYDFYVKSSGITTDTRSVLPGQLFFALKGERFDGNEFARQALEKGATLAVVDRADLPDEFPFFKVPDVLLALQQLASYHRSMFNVPVLAIGGSNGKTTTKELVAAVLSSHYNTFSTPGNLNNHIGVPLSILKVGTGCEMMVLELGANHPGEIVDLCEICRPTHGYITNVGQDHLEGFGSVEGVLRANAELYDFLERNNGHVFLNSYQQELSQLGSKVSSKSSFPEDHDDYRIISKSTATSNIIEVEGMGSISSVLPGRHNFENIAAAIAIGQFFHVPFEKIKSSIESYVPKNNRSQIEQIQNATLILDAYNANPSSMKAAIEAAKAYAGSRNWVVVLGDMFEMGVFAKQVHLEVLETLAKSGVSEACLVGEHFFEHRSHFPHFHFFKTTPEVELPVLTKDQAGSVFLIKGSRGMRLEMISEQLKEAFKAT